MGVTLESQGVHIAIEQGSAGMVGAGPPVMLDSGVAVASTGKVVRLRARGANTRDALPRLDPLVDALEQHGDLLQIVEAFDVEAGPRSRDATEIAPQVVQVRVPPATGVDLVVVYDEASGLWRWEVPRQDAVRSPYAAAPSHFEVVFDAPPPLTGRRGFAGRVAARIARFVVVRVTDELLAKGAQRVAELFEQRSRKGGLRWFTTADAQVAKPAEADQLRGPDLARLGEGPSLLFLHGTLAQAHTAFRRVPAPLLERCARAYDDRVWAYDHHTLSKTPAQNATDLLSRLRQLNAPHLVVDVIAHSRGGLVARELAELQARGSLIDVRSVLFVATPNGGTPLCDPAHLQRLVDRYTNIFALVPDNPVTDIIDALSSVAAAVALRAVGGLVGLAAMDPNGHYQKEIAGRRMRNGLTYHAIASDFDPIAGSGLVTRLRDLATDHIFDGVANDLIVPTDSVYGSRDQALVGEDGRYVFTRESGVDHSSFWDRPEFTQCLERWLPVAAAVRSAPIASAEPDTTAATLATAARADDDADDVEDDDFDDGRQVVHIKAVHASLEHSSHPLIVGHFRGVALQGAGQFLDARLGGRLSTRLLLGLLPEQIGESVVIDNRPEGADRAYPPGALVVGLGAPGELTRERLTASVARAMLGFAIEVFDGQRPYGEGHPGEPIALRFSAVPIGTSGAGGLSAEACVVALADAVITVNDKLYRHRDARRGSAWARVRIGELEIVSLWEDRAELVAHAVRRVGHLHQVDTGVHTELVPESHLIVREGSLRRRPDAEELAGEWQRLIVRDKGREHDPVSGALVSPPGTLTLEFTAVGGRARADRVEVAVDAEAVQALITSATTDPRPGDQVNRTLFELLVPTALKQELFRFDNLQFIVDENTADFPWEALAAGDDRELAIRCRLLRQFQEFEGSRQDVRSPVGDNVLVIGNPPAAPAPSLDGARREAELVADFLTPHFSGVHALVWDTDGRSVRDDFDQLEGPPGRRVLNALFAQEWQIVHVAAHGQFDAHDPSRSGVVIGPEMFITANVVRQLPVVPELVFLNCCHLGQVAEAATALQNPHRLAASVARELMRIGVRAVVAAGWAVDDDPAAEFACTFYDELLEGRLLGDAVYAARRLVREKHRYSMTWCAFQCYGDPSFQLREAPSLHGPARRPQNEEKGALPFVSTQELIRRVQTIEALAGTIGVPGFDELTRAEEAFADELRDYVGSLRDDWERPEVFAAFGSAFTELGCYREAVDCYRRAWFDGPNNSVPLRVLEQLGNVEMRLAQRVAPAHPEAAADLATQAATRLELALRIGRTGERLSLLGSLHKKAATLATEDERPAHLAQSCSWYREAYEWTLDENATTTEQGRIARLDPYYVHAWIQMSSLAGDPVDDQAELLLDAIERSPSEPCVVIDGHRVTAVSVAEPADVADQPDDYWARVARANNLLTRGILRGAPDIAGLDEKYREAFSTRASRRNRDSTIDNLRDLAVLVGDSRLAELAESLANRGQP